MADENAPLSTEDSHKVYEQHPPALQQPNTEQYSQYAHSEQQQQYTYTSQQPQYPHGNQPMPPAYTYPNSTEPHKSSPSPIIALILGILSFLLPVLAPFAIVIGIIGTARTKTNKGMSIAGLVLGLIATFFWVSLIVGLFSLLPQGHRPDGDPSASSEAIDVEFGTYGEHNGYYSLPVTVTNNSSVTVEVHLEIQAQTKDGGLIEETNINIIAVRPGYSCEEMAFTNLTNASNGEIEDATFVATKISAYMKKVNDTEGAVTLGDLTHEKIKDYNTVYWNTHMDVTYTNKSTSETSCTVDISINDPHAKKTLYVDVISFEDVQPGKSVTQPAFENLPYPDDTKNAPWFTRKGLEYDIVGYTCY